MLGLGPIPGDGPIPVTGEGPMQVTGVVCVPGWPVWEVCAVGACVCEQGIMLALLEPAEHEGCGPEWLLSLWLGECSSGNKSNCI